MEIINPLSYPDWDDLVRANSGCTFFHCSNWLRVLRDSYGYQPIAFVSQSEGAEKVIVPVMEVKSVITGRRGVCLPFSDYCTPLYASQGMAPEGVIDAVLDYGWSRGWAYFDIRGGQSERTKPYSCYLHHTLDLRQGESKIYESLQDNTKRNIKKSIREQVNVRFTNSLTAVKSFYRLHLLNRKKHGLPPQPFSFFNNIQKHILQVGRGNVVEAVYQGTTIASLIFFHFGNWVIYKYGASDPAFLQHRPNNLVMWEAIKFYIQNGFEILSLGRTDKEDEGLARYKDGWGTHREFIYYFRFPLKKGAGYKEKPETTTSYLFNKMPLCLLPVVGKLLYKHFG